MVDEGRWSRSAPIHTSASRLLGFTSHFPLPPPGLRPPPRLDLRDIGGFRDESTLASRSKRHACRVSGEADRQNLNGDVAIQAGVALPVDFAHTPAPMESRIFMRAETAPSGEGNGRMADCIVSATAFPLAN
jgi:hypothetical protein